MSDTSTMSVQYESVMAKEPTSNVSTHNHTDHRSTLPVARLGHDQIIRLLVDDPSVFSVDQLSKENGR